MKKDQQISEVLEKLLSHDITKRDAIMSLLIITSIEDSNSKIPLVLDEAVSAVYFRDSSDYLSYLYNIIHILTGLPIEKIYDDDFISSLYDKLNPE